MHLTSSTYLPLTSSPSHLNILIHTTKSAVTEHITLNIDCPLSATRPHLIITHHHHHHDIFINIATQNVGGLKTESERGSGPKISVLRSLVKKKLDFFVLTEARVDVRAVQKLKLRRDLHVTMHSLHQRPRGGVIVFSKKMHKLIPDSVRHSQTPGHFAAGVYEVGTHRIMVVGVYGCSEGDRPSLAVINDLRDRVAELSHVFRTHSIILAGDFNATLMATDSNNLMINKPNTVQSVLALMEDHHLVDLGAQTGWLIIPGTGGTPLATPHVLI
jgi:exonuclease III